METSTIVDVIVNSVALKFILDLDGMTMSPNSLQTKTQQLQQTSTTDEQHYKQRWKRTTSKNNEAKSAANLFDWREVG